MHRVLAMQQQICSSSAAYMQEVVGQQWLLFRQACHLVQLFLLAAFSHECYFSWLRLLSKVQLFLLAISLTFT